MAITISRNGSRQTIFLSSPLSSLDARSLVACLPAYRHIQLHFWKGSGFMRRFALSAALCNGRFAVAPIKNGHLFCESCGSITFDDIEPFSLLWSTTMFRTLQPAIVLGPSKFFCPFSLHSILGRVTPRASFTLHFQGNVRESYAIAVFSSEQYD